MKSNARKAFTALKNLGVTVIESDDYGHFVISGEDGKGFADYYQEYTREHYHPDDTDLPHAARRIENAFGIRTDVNKILDKHGLYAEWIDPGTLGVYDI